MRFNNRYAMALCLTLSASAVTITACKGRNSPESKALADDSQANNSRRWNGPQCFFGSSITSISRLQYLSIDSRYEIKAGDTSIWTIRQWLKPAIISGMQELTGESFSNVDDALRVADDDMVWYSPLTNYLSQADFPISQVDSASTDVRSKFYLVEVSMGDNMHGFVIQADLGASSNQQSRPFKIVNRYGDGDTYNCDIARPSKQQKAKAPLPQRLCAFGQDISYISGSLNRKNGVWRKAQESEALTASTNLTSVQEREIRDGMITDGVDPSQSVADMIKETDEEEVIFQEMTYSKTGKKYRWYHYYGGDNPVGFIYGPDTQGVEGKVAVVGDGDIGGCRLKKKR